MASKVLTTEAIALTEKKMDMTLDDIIKMSKNKPPKGKQPPRQSIKGRGFQNDLTYQPNNKVQRFMDSRSSVRQGVLAHRRSNIQKHQFQVTKETARKAASIPICRRAVSWKNSRTGATAAALRQTVGGSFAAKDKVLSKQKPQTLDARFATMKEQRMKAVSQQARHGIGCTTAQRRNVQLQQHAAGPSNGRVSQFSKFTR